MYGILIFSTAFTISRKQSVYRATSIQSMPQFFFLKTNFNIIPYNSLSSKWPLSLRIPHKTLHTSHLFPYVLHEPHNSLFFIWSTENVLSNNWKMAELWSSGWLILDFVAGNFSIPCCKTILRQRLPHKFIYTNRSEEYILRRKSEVRLYLEATDNLSTLLSDLKLEHVR